MSRNQQIRGLGFIEAEMIALITGYPDNHFLVTRHPDNRHKMHPTKEFVRNYKLFMQNKPKVKSAENDVSSFLISKYVLIGHLVIQTTKPIQSQFKPIQANPKPICRKGKN